MDRKNRKLANRSDRKKIIETYVKPKIMTENVFVPSATDCTLASTCQGPSDVQTNPVS